MVIQQEPEDLDFFKEYKVEHTNEQSLIMDKKKSIIEKMRDEDSKISKIMSASNSKN